MAEKDFIVEKQRIITAIEEIDRKLAEIKGVSPGECAAVTLENGKRFFGIGGNAPRP